MFCGECGTKNEKDSAFCSNCGSKLEHEEETEVIEKPAKKTTKKTAEKKEEKKVEQNVEEKEVTQVEEPKQEVPVTPSTTVVERVVVQEQPKTMSKKTKNIIIVLIVLAVLGFGAYKFGEELTSPKNVAKEYIKAVINQDLGTLYKYLELGKDKTFVTSKIFKEVFKDKAKTESKISNYKVTDVEYSDLTAIVKFTYTTKSSSDEKKDSVKLIKTSKKKYYIYDEWKIADLTAEDVALEDYTIKVSKGAKLEFAGVKVASKYIDKDESSDSVDVYVLPQVFRGKTKVKATLDNGVVIENEVVPSSYNKVYTVKFDENSLTEKQKKELVNSFKEILSDLYDNAIDGKKYDDIKDDYKNTGKKFETNYNEFVDDIANSYNKLSKIEFKEIKLSDVSLNDDGNLVVKVRASYDYTVKYTTYSGEDKTSEKSDYNYITLVLGSSKSKYYLVDIERISTYFYR